MNRIPESPFTGDPGPNWAPPPSTQNQPPVARQLVRDPYTKLGGVASGLSHHYGLDVSLVRLAFVLFTLVTGFGLVIYLVAWLIVPRAQYWPPHGTNKPMRSLSTREIAIGLLLVGVVVGMFVNGGPFSSVLVPVVLIATGIWLLVQPDVENVSSGPAAFASAAPPLVDTPPYYEVPPPNVGQAGAPVPPRSRRRKGVVIGLIGMFILLPIMAIGGLVIAFLVSDISANPGFTATYRPMTVEDIPTEIDHSQGKIVLDLSLLNEADFDDAVRIDLNVDFGEIDVIVPEEVAVDIQAEGGIGDVRVFDRTEDGIDPEISVPDSNADIFLEVSVGVGDVTVERP